MSTRHVYEAVVDGVYAVAHAGNRVSSQRGGSMDERTARRRMSAAHENAPKPGIPCCSWWADRVREGFTAHCERDELPRMRLSKEHRRMGSPMVLAQIDGKQQRTS